MQIRPSSLPMLAQCPCFESDNTEFAEDGDKRHALFQSLLRGHTVMTGVLPNDEFDAVTWASGFVRMTTGGADIEIERKLSLLDSEFNTILEGTPDVVCGREIFDLKWRERDYGPQMAAYALMLMQDRGYESVTVHLLFAERQKVQKLNFDKELAERLVFETIDNIFQAPKPLPCDYCGWCANRLRCPALTERAQTVAAGRDDWKLENFHSSQINKPAEMAKALRLARELKPWIESVEYHALELSKTQAIPGYERKERRGNLEVKDIAEAHRLSGLNGEDFIKACKVSIPTLAEQFAEANGMKQAPARKALEEKLASVMERRPSTFQLVKNKEQ